MKRYIFRFLFIGSLLFMFGLGLAQFPKLKIKIPKKIPGLDKILKSKPALSTSIEDAVTGIPFLDDFDPESAMPMTLLPRTPEGGFILEYPGIYMFECQSYCLAPGKYSPSGKYGYLYAPLKGPWADIIRNILQKSYNHPEIPQRDIQVLLWAIISRTKISNMSREMQVTAAKLLTLKEIFRINGGALGLIPKKLMDKAFENLPPAARRVMEAEAQLREMLNKAQATYEELERVAILQGDPPLGEGSRDIPRGRWSFHPNGYFIRYFPRGYQRTLIELYFPEPMQVKRDTHGRITLIADKRGNRLETEYDDTIEILSIPGDSSLKGYAYRSIYFEHFDPENPREKQRSMWNNIGWTLVGIPTGKGHGNVSSESFSDVSERYDLAKIHKKDLDDLCQGIKKLRGKRAWEGLSQDNREEIMALSHYTVALKRVIDSRSSDEEEEVCDAIILVKKAWQSVIAKHMSISQEKPIFNPAEDPASGNTSEQPKGDSKEPTDKTDKCQKEYTDCLSKPTKELDDAIKSCYKNLNLSGGCNLNNLLMCLYLYEFSSCMDSWCGHSGLKKLSEDEQYELIDCISRALLKYRMQEEKCARQYQKCMDAP